MGIQITPFPEAYRTNPPLCYSKVPDVPMVSWSQQATVENTEESDSDENEEEFEEDKEVLGEENTSWTHSPFTAGIFIPVPDQGKAAAALADLRLIIAPKRNTGIGHKDPKLDLLLHSSSGKIP